MEVILKQDVKNVGRTGQVVKVANGYGRNFLIPRGLAVEATPAGLRDLATEKDREARRVAQELRAATEVAARLEGLTLTIPARAGETGRLFGSVTNQDIARSIKDAVGLEVDRRKVELPEPIRELGRHEIKIKLNPHVTATIRVEVVRQEV